MEGGVRLCWDRMDAAVCVEQRAGWPAAHATSVHGWAPWAATSPLHLTRRPPLPCSPSPAPLLPLSTGGHGRHGLLRARLRGVHAARHRRLLPAQGGRLDPGARLGGWDRVGGVGAGWHGMLQARQAGGGGARRSPPHTRSARTPAPLPPCTCAQEDSAPDYLAKAEECLRDEEERVNSYLHLSTKPKLLKEVRAQEGCSWAEGRDTRSPRRRWPCRHAHPCHPPARLHRPAPPHRRRTSCCACTSSSY